MNTAPTGESRRSEGSSAASAEDAPVRYESGRGCLMMLGASLLCAIAIVAAFVLFGDFSRD